MFSKMVIEKNLSEDRKLLEELNKKYAKVLDDMETKCENQRNVYLKNMEHKAKVKESKLISRTESEVQNRILVKKNELFKELKLNLIQSVEKITTSDGYKDFFKEQFTEAVKDFDDKDSLIIGIKKDDLSLVPSIYKTIIEDDLLGGFYIVENNKVKYDYTLNTEINGIQDFLGGLTNALFESSEEADNEDE